MAFEHVSVLLHETVDGLNVRPDGIYVDATLGGGGHAFEVCSRLNDKGRFIGIDQDADAIKAAGERLAGFGEKVTIVRSNYRDMKPQLQNIGVDKVDGIVLDLGVSSYQLDTAERGFSCRAARPYCRKSRAPAYPADMRKHQGQVARRRCGPFQETLKCPVYWRNCPSPVEACPGSPRAAFQRRRSRLHLGRCRLGCRWKAASKFPANGRRRRAYSRHKCRPA